MEFRLNPNFIEEMAKPARQRLVSAAASLVTYIKTVKLSRGRRTQGDALSAGEPPYSWSSKLRNSITYKWADGDPNTIQVGEWGYFPGLVQEVGAPNAEFGINPVRAKGGGLMTIPRSDEAVRHQKSGGSARTFPKKLTMIPSRGRTGILFLVESKRAGKVNAARSVIHYVLARNVVIPPHPWLRPSLDEHWETMLRILGGAA